MGPLLPRPPGPPESPTEASGWPAAVEATWRQKKDAKLSTAEAQEEETDTSSDLSVIRHKEGKEIPGATETT